MRRIKLRLSIPENHAIALFKKDSMGEIVGWYKTVKEIADVEKMFNGRFNAASIYSCLNGNSRYFKSLNHQCLVKPKIIPYAKNKATTKTTQNRTGSV